MPTEPRRPVPPDTIDRRAFTMLLAGTALAWPLAAYAQQRTPVVGFLSSQSADTFAHLVAAFRAGLKEGGYEEGRNVAVEYRWADGQTARLPALAAELVQRGVALIVASGGTVVARAAQMATATLPIVFTTGSDPVAAGLVASLNRPGGNVTGVMMLGAPLDPKRLAFLHELLPSAPIAALLNPTSPNFPVQTKELEEQARVLGVPFRILTARDDAEIDRAFADAAGSGPGALLVGSDTFFNSRRERVVALAARYRLPAIYEQREFADAGGLMSYGVSLTDVYRQAALWTVRMLNGEDPATLPVFQGARFEFVINLGTARALGLTIPQSLLFAANDTVP